MQEQESLEALQARKLKLEQIHTALSNMHSGTYGPGEAFVVRVAVPLVIGTFVWLVIGAIYLTPVIDSSQSWGWLVTSAVAALLLWVVAKAIKGWGSSYNEKCGTWADKVASLLHGYEPLCAAGYEQVVNASPSGELDAEVLWYWVEKQELPEVTARLNELKPRMTIKLQGSNK